MNMPPIHLQPHEWEQVSAILRQHLPSETVWAFGSRATGERLKRFSDLDLAVAAALTWSQRASLSGAFEESLLPFKVDIVELPSLGDAFRRRIEGDFVPLQGPELASTDPSRRLSEHLHS